MNFNKNTIKTLKKISNDDRWGYFFENIDTKSDQVPDELIAFLADMLAVEIGAHHEDLDKIKFFIKLGFFAHE